MGMTLDIKESLHNLIDKTDNPDLLEMVYQLLNSKLSNKTSELLNTLTENEKKDPYKAYNDSSDDANLIDLKDIRKKHSKWREK